MKGIIIFIVCACFYSCSGDNQKFNRNVVDLSFEEMMIEPFVGNPYQIVVADNLLILADDIDGKALLLYNLENNSSRRVLDIGQGTNEIISPIDLDVYNNELVVLQRRTGECRSYNFDKLYKDKVPEYQKIILNNSDRCCKTDYGYVFMGFDENNIFACYNLEDSICSSVDFDEYVIEDLPLKYKLFQGKLAYSKQTETLVYAPTFSSYIKFYVWNNGKWKLKTSFPVGKNIIENRVVEKTKLDINERDIRHCLDICASDKHFYILYDGLELGNKNKEIDRYILKLDSHL